MDNWTLSEKALYNLVAEIKSSHFISILYFLQWHELCAACVIVLYLFDI